MNKISLDKRTFVPIFGAVKKYERNSVRTSEVLRFDLQP